MTKPKEPCDSIRNHLDVGEQMALEELIQQHLDEHESVFGYHEHTEVFADPAEAPEAIAESAEDYVAAMHQQLTMTKHLSAVMRKLKE